jgi:excisionase family DNA binding protein
VTTLLLTVEEAAAELRVGRTEVFALIKSGEIKSKKIGTRRRIPYAALVAYVKALPDDEPEGH